MSLFDRYIAFSSSCAKLIPQAIALKGRCSFWYLGRWVGEVWHDNWSHFKELLASHKIVLQRGIESRENMIIQYYNILHDYTMLYVHIIKLHPWN